MRRLQRFELKKTSSSSSFKARSKSARLLNDSIAHGERSKEAAADSSNAVPTGFKIKEEGNGEGSHQRLKAKSSSANLRESTDPPGSSRIILSSWSTGKLSGESWSAIISAGSLCRRSSGWKGLKLLIPTLSGRSISWARRTSRWSENCTSSVRSTITAGSSLMANGSTVSMGLMSTK